VQRSVWNFSQRRLRVAFALLMVAGYAPQGLARGCLAAQPLEIKIGYLHEPSSKARISLIDIPASNEGLRERLRVRQVLCRSPAKAARI
jgi:hypothetical protein